MMNLLSIIDKVITGGDYNKQAGGGALGKAVTLAKATALELPWNCSVTARKPPL